MMRSLRSAKNSARRTRKGKRVSRRPAKKGTKRKLNSYIRAANKARKSGSKSFKYKGKTYTRKRLGTGMVVFKSSSR